MTQENLGLKKGKGLFFGPLLFFETKKKKEEKKKKETCYISTVELVTMETDMKCLYKHTCKIHWQVKNRWSV